MALRAVRTLGLQDGIAFPQLIVARRPGASSSRCAARIPGGQMADLAFHALGVDLVEIALRQALGEEAPDELVMPRLSHPTRDPLPHRPPGPAAGRARSRSQRARPVLRAPGVVQADVFLQEGETIRPVRLDGDRRGYVIAIGQTNVQALERAEAAARLLYVETERTCRDLRIRSRPLPRAARGGEGRRVPVCLLRCATRAGT